MITSRQAVLRCYEAFERRDVEALFSLLDPDCEIEQSSLLPWGGFYSGHEGLLAFLQRLTSHLDSCIEIEETVEAGDHLLVIGRTQGQVLKNSLAFDVRFVHDWTVREGRIHRFSPYIDTPEMLGLIGQSCQMPNQ